MSTTGLDLDSLLGAAREAVLAAAALALDPGGELRVETKQNDKDLVTQVDRGAERIVAERITPTGIPLHGEEEHRVEGFEAHSGPAWVVDPIDGTTNYVATHRDWAVSLALVDGGAPVVAALADPVAGRLMTAVAERGAWVGPLRAASDADEPIPPAPDLPLERGAAIVPFSALGGVPGADGVAGAALAARAYGSAALEIAEVARGTAVAFLHGGLKPWDMRRRSSWPVRRARSSRAPMDPLSTCAAPAPCWRPRPLRTPRSWRSSPAPAAAPRRRASRGLAISGRGPGRRPAARGGPRRWGAARRQPSPALARHPGRRGRRGGGRRRQRWTGPRAPRGWRPRAR